MPVPLRSRLPLTLRLTGSSAMPVPLASIPRSAITCRATRITAHLKNGGTLEDAPAMANHASTRTSQLYDRRRDEVNRDEVERISIQYLPVLLCCKFLRCKFPAIGAAQHGHRERLLAIATISRRRIVAIELGT